MWVLQGAALLVSFLGADAASQGFISVSNGAFVDANCTEFIPVGWNSCVPSPFLIVARSWSVPDAPIVHSSEHL